MICERTGGVRQQELVHPGRVPGVTQGDAQHGQAAHVVQPVPVARDRRTIVLHQRVQCRRRLGAAPGGQVHECPDDPILRRQRRGLRARGELDLDRIELSPLFAEEDEP